MAPAAMTDGTPIVEIVNKQSSRTFSLWVTLTVPPCSVIGS